MSGYTIAWITWTAGFVVIEGLALFNRREGDTLSEHVWRLFHTAKGTVPDRTTRGRRFVLVAFMAWLSTHLLTGGDF